MPKPSFPSVEYQLLNSLKTSLNFTKSPRYPIPIGDDAAILVCGKNEKLILTADTFVENVHFNLAFMALEQVGYKAMAINLSDCAAMAATPDSALVQIVFPKNQSVGKTLSGIKRVYKGLNEACRKWDFPIIGGNLSKGPCWMIDITLLGRTENRNRLLLRKGARHGDGLWVTGFPGESGAGLACLKKWGSVKKVPAEYAVLVRKHLRPVPRIKIARELAKERHVHALIDISDGISKDSRTLAYENNLGILLDDEPGCISGPMRRLAGRLKRDWRDWYLNGGEDYELLFAASPAFDPSRLAVTTGVPVSRIGVFSKSFRGVRLRKENNTSARLNLGGWDHLQNA
ncbi:MAG TPA: thiamine-phosphate kinase [Chitinivibrionales bacterium]|nr:thiamine-phosphate kinase [Chitinivibrionales bacterium]